jgi:hypothetical protein
VDYYGSGHDPEVVDWFNREGLDTAVGGRYGNRGQPERRRPEPDHRGEHLGARCRILLDTDANSGDPVKLVLAGAPRELPVSQDVEHGADVGRQASFRRGWTTDLDEAVGADIVDDLGSFWDRRREGRRYRSTNDEVIAQGAKEPYRRLPAGIDPSDLQRRW